MRARLILSLILGACFVACGAAYAANPPPVLTVAVGYDLTLSWNPVSTYVGGQPLAHAPEYKLYSISAAGVPGFLGYTGAATSARRVLNTAGIQCFAVSAAIWDPNSNESAKTPTLCVNVTGTSVAVVPSPPSLSISQANWLARKNAYLASVLTRNSGTDPASILTGIEASGHASIAQVLEQARVTSAVSGLAIR